MPLRILLTGACPCAPYVLQVEIEGHRVLYIVRQGQSFGESVLTGRNRRSTERAATACDLFTLSAENLQKLFISRPREGRLLHQALLREHLRKVKLSNIALRLVISKLMDGESILSPGGTAQATSRQDVRARTAHARPTQPSPHPRILWPSH